MMLNRRASSFLDDSGAETAEVLGLWDTELAKRTKGRLMCDQLLRNLGQKWVITSDFSGIDAPRECCRIIANHVVKQLGQSQAHISFVRSCDIGQHQKQFFAVAEPGAGFKRRMRFSVICWTGCLRQPEIGYSLPARPKTCLWKRPRQPMP